MSYQVRRIDPYWIKHPMILLLTAAGAVLMLLGRLDRAVLFLPGGIALGAGVFLATKPAISVVAGSLGLVGGLVTFVFLPNVSMAGMSGWLKLLSAGLFSLLYMLLMDAVVLVTAFLYNFFGAILGGFTVDLEEGGSSEEA